MRKVYVVGIRRTPETEADLESTRSEIEACEVVYDTRGCTLEVIRKVINQLDSRGDIVYPRPADRMSPKLKAEIHESADRVMANARIRKERLRVQRKFPILTGRRIPGSAWRLTRAYAVLRLREAGLTFDRFIAALVHEGGDDADLFEAIYRIGRCMVYRSDRRYVLEWWNAIEESEHLRAINVLVQNAPADRAVLSTAILRNLRFRRKRFFDQEYIGKIAAPGDGVAWVDSEEGDP